MSNARPIHLSLATSSLATLHDLIASVQTGLGALRGFLILLLEMGWGIVQYRTFGAQLRS
jgi:hypothetical protein